MGNNKEIRKTFIFNRQFSRRQILKGALSTSIGLITIACGMPEKPDAPNPLLGRNQAPPFASTPTSISELMPKTPEPSPTPESTSTPKSTPIPEPTPEPTASIEVPKPAEVVWRGNADKPQIYLTIDDGWDPAQVEQALDVAQKYNVHLTFYPVGRTIGFAPELYKRAVAQGHAIENHTWSHEWLENISEDEIRYQILKQQEAVQEAVGGDYRQYFLRPPGGAGIFGYQNPLLLKVCGELGLKVAMWSSDSNGWRVYPRTDQDAINYILGNVFENFFQGTIILQHAIPDDIIALPSIIGAANANNWQMITMREGIK